MKKTNSGLNIDLGNYCSGIAFQWAKQTFKNRENKAGSPCLDLEGSFANIMDFNGVKVGISSDGIGTKIEIAERTGIYNTIGFDLVAMVADDLITSGIEPVNLSNILDVDHLDGVIVDALMNGLHDACNTAGIAITGGEIAELGDRIGGYGDKMHFNWCATGIGILPEDGGIIDGRNITEGDVVVSLKSRGFRSNGFSLLRKIMEDNFGNEWHTASYGNNKSWGDVLLTPSLIFTPLVTKLLQKGHQVKGIVHVTGGGIQDNLSRILKSRDFGAILDNLYPPPDFMLKVQELGDVSEEQAYLLWNMGNGMLIILSEGESTEFINSAADLGYSARIGGEITDKPEILLKSAGCEPKALNFSYKS